MAASGAPRCYEASVPVRAVLVDVGGVLEVNPATGWLDRWAARFQLTTAELGHRLERLWCGGDVGTVTLAEIERRTAADLGLDEKALLELMGDVWAEYLGTLNRPLTEFVQSLRPRIKTGIVSNSFVGAREREEDAYGFGNMFDAIVYSHEVGHLKPEPAIYTIACERLGVAPAEALFVDDLEANVDGARAVGMDAITFVDTEQAISDISARLAAT
jgi:epoxide hydrolase-like predicted phosphatase